MRLIFITHNQSKFNIADLSFNDSLGYIQNNRVYRIPYWNSKNLYPRSPMFADPTADSWLAIACVLPLSNTFVYIQSVKLRFGSSPRPYETRDPPWCITTHHLQDGRGVPLASIYIIWKIIKYHQSNWYINRWKGRISLKMVWRGAAKFSSPTRTDSECLARRL